MSVKYWIPLLAFAGAVALSGPVAAAGKVPAKPTAKSVRAPNRGAVLPAVVSVPVELAALTPEQLAIADKVHVGRIPCELAAQVTLTANPHAMGRFVLEIGKHRYAMEPVVTSTGAVRLEDPNAGAVWLQLANKSMLMNQKLGQRIADECMNPEQLQVAQALLHTPAPHLLDAPKNALVPVVADQVAQEMVPNTIK